MRYLIVSDMHGNWDAFECVLKAVDLASFDRILVLGDLVGYGGSPNEVVEAVRDLDGRSVVIRGNHDKVVSGVDDGINFNFAALTAARWTTRSLSDENLRFVRELPLGPVEVEPGTVICHGSPLDEDAYVFSDMDAREVFLSGDAWLTFFGHTHIPCVFCQGDEGIEVGLLRGKHGRLQLDPNQRYLINPGSIGQPRDRDPRASYIVFDSETGTVSWYRLTYPVEKAQRRILEAGLPRVLADRLAVGQ
ncbi:MAG: metallophosphoesterase family protein [Acidobacteria bacterium]|nr:metallophosphoesterase family protein [Acidobacteriota bacterium]